MNKEDREWVESKYKDLKEGFILAVSLGIINCFFLMVIIAMLVNK